jgi:hypothetical protein
VNSLHLVLAAVLDTASTGGLPRERAEALFESLSGYLSHVPAEAVAACEEAIRRVLDRHQP